VLTVENKKRYTADDYSLLKESAPFQLINFDLVISPSPNPLHQIISGRLFNIISVFLEQTANGGVVMYAPMDVKFDEGNVLQPDILYISSERKAEIMKDKIEGAPDLIIEILSPSNAYYDLRQKKDIYEKYGVKEYIIIDPIDQSADLFLLKDGSYALHQRARLEQRLNSVLLPGFDIEVKNLFK